MRAFPTCSVLHLLPVPITDPCSFSWRCQSRTRHNIDNNKSISVDVGTMFNPYPSPFQNPSAFASTSLKPYFNFHFHFQFHFQLCCLPSSDSNDIEIQTPTETKDSIPYTSVDDDGVKIEIEKLPNNSRRILSSVAIAAPLDAVWNVLTDYERLSDFIPSLAVSRLLLQSPNYARLFQTGEQDLALGLKFSAKGIIDCYEKPLEILSSTSGSGSGSALKRDIDFQMVQGDFEIFQGTWSLLQQLHMLETESETQEDGDTDTDKTTTTTTLLRYVVDVKPKLWLPVRLVEGRLCNNIKINLASIRQYAQKRSSFTL